MPIHPEDRVLLMIATEGSCTLTYLDLLYLDVKGTLSGAVLIESTRQKLASRDVKCLILQNQTKGNNSQLSVRHNIQQRNVLSVQ